MTERSRFLLSLAAAVAVAMASVACKDKEPDVEQIMQARQDAHEELADEYIEITNDFADLLEASVQGIAEAEAAKAEVKAISARFEALGERMERLGDPQGDAKARFEKKLAEVGVELGRRTSEAVAAVRSNPEVAAILREPMAEFGERMDALEVFERWTQGDQGSE